MDQLNQILNSLLSLLSLTNGSQISNNSTTSTGTDKSSTDPESGPSTDTVNNFLQLETNDYHQSTSKRDTDEKKQLVQQILKKTASTDPGFNANQFLYKKHRKPDNSEE